MASLANCDNQYERYRVVTPRTYEAMTPDFRKERLSEALCEECWDIIDGSGVMTARRLRLARTQFRPRVILRQLRIASRQLDQMAGGRFRVHYDETCTEHFLEVLAEGCFFCGYLPVAPSEVRFVAPLPPQLRPPFHFCSDAEAVRLQPSTSLPTQRRAVLLQREWRMAPNKLHRMVSTGAFTEGNVVSCCNTCDRFKGDADLVPFLERIAAEVLEHDDEMLAAMQQVRRPAEA